MMNTKSFILLILILSISFIQCKKETTKEKDNEIILLPEPPNPNSIVNTKHTSNSVSFSLTKDCYLIDESIIITSTLTNGIADLWIFGDNAVTYTRDANIKIKNPGIIPIMHIVTLNDTLQNIYRDTIYVGTMALIKYEIESIAYPSVRFRTQQSGSGSLSAYTTSYYNNGIYPFILKFHTGLTVYNYAPITFSMIDNPGTVLESSIIDMNTVPKYPVNTTLGKFQIFNGGGTKVWAHFMLK